MMEFRILVCGGRYYSNKNKLYDTLDELKKIHDNLTEMMVTNTILKIIQGGASGADKLASQWAKDNHIEQEQYDADWKQYGKAAGPIRNELMLKFGKPHLVVAFSGGTGTQNMITLANKYNIPVEKIDD